MFRPLLFVLLGSLGLLSGCGSVTFVVGLSPGHQPLQRKVVHQDREPGWFLPRVAVIDISGLISNNKQAGLLRDGENPVALLDEQLQAAAADPRVKAIILRINSPGGGVTASDVMYREIERFKEEHDIPVVALLMDVAASGGYYVACASDKIVAYPTSVTGSIGVIVQTISLERGLAMFGIDTDAIISGPNKDTGSPFSSMTEEQRATLQALVDDFYEGFLDRVRHARPNISEEDFARVTDGRVVSGTEAVAAGLADMNGDLFDAYEQAKQLAGLDHAQMVLYHRPLQHAASPYAPSAAAPITQQNNLIHIDTLDGSIFNTSPQFLYLWTGQ